VKILIPVDSKDLDSAKLTNISAEVDWLCMEIVEAKVVSKKIYSSSNEALEEWVDAVVVCGDFEPVMEFIESQVMVLVAHTQRELDDIVEAFLFKELMELGF